MSTLVAMEAEAVGATRQPRFTFQQGLLVATGGSAVIAFALTWFVVFVWTAGPLWVVLLAALAYSLALLVWAGLWSRPIQAVTVIAASLVGLVAGYVLAIFVANVVSTGPDL